MKKRFRCISAAAGTLTCIIFFSGVFSRKVFADVVFWPSSQEIIDLLLPVILVMGLVGLCVAVGIILVQKKHVKEQEEKRKASLLRKEEQAGLNVSERIGSEGSASKEYGAEEKDQADAENEAETDA